MKIDGGPISNVKHDCIADVVENLFHAFFDNHAIQSAGQQNLLMLRGVGIIGAARA